MNRTIRQHIWQFIGVIILFLTISIIAYGNENYAIKKIVIDAGHGGKDPGTCGHSGCEKDVVLLVSLKLGNMLKKHYPHIEIIYTRTTDKYISLEERADIANKADADLFLSIHANSLPSNHSTKGAESYILGLHKTKENLEVAKRENSVMLLDNNHYLKYEGFDPNSTEAYIIFNLMQNVYLGESLDFASEVQQSININAKRIDRGVKQAGFWVLHQTSMPSVLIELGFMSNKQEEKYLLSNSGQLALAKSIFRAFGHYVQKQRANLNISFDTDKQKNNDDLIFKVQILSSTKPTRLHPRNFYGFKNVEEHKTPKYFKYTVGNCKSLDNARDLYLQIKKDVPDSFIVALKQGKFITLKEARKYLK